MVRLLLVVILSAFGCTSFSQTWQELDSQVIVLFNAADYAKAIPVAQKAIDAAKKEFGINHPNYASSLNNLALLYSTTGQFEKAEPLYVQAIDLGRKNPGGDQLSFATNLTNVALFYSNLGRYAKAESLYLEAKEIRRKKLGENHPDYAVSLYHIAQLYSRMGRYAEPELLLKQSLDVLRKTVGESDPRYSFPLNALAELYRKTGQYKNSEDLFIDALTVRKKIFGDGHPYYASSLINLADLYSEMGEYKKAEDLYLQAIDINKKALGEDHPDYAAGLHNLAELYRGMGQFEKAEPIYLTILAIEKRSLGTEHPNYAVALNNLAALYQQIGQYQKSESLYLEAIEINKRSLGENHLEYAINLNDLGELYKTMGQLDKASSLYAQAEEILDKAVGEEHPSYGMVLNNLANICVDIGNYQLAEALYNKSIEIKKKLLGENNRSIAIYLNNLAYLNEITGKFDKSEHLYKQSLDIIKGTMGENHPDYCNTLHNLAGLYLHQKQYKKTEPLLYLSNKILRQNTVSTFAVLSEKEKGNYLEMNLGNFEMANSVLFMQKDNTSVLLKDNFNQLLFLKSLTLFDSRSLLQSVYNNPDSTIKKLFIDWQSQKGILAKQYALPLDKRVDNLKIIEDKTENLEKELNRRSSSFQHQQAAIHISLENVQSKLQKDEAALEFVRFRLYDTTWTDSIIYAAYLLRKTDSLPQFIPLCEERQLAKFFQAGTNEKVKAIYRSDVVDEDNDKVVLGDSLYNLIWKPLLPYLSGIKKIDYSPAGLLYKVAFHALPANDKQLLLDQYELHQLVSVKEIAERHDEDRLNNNIVLFGNSAFTMDSASMTSERRTDQKVSNIFSSKISRGNSEAWRTLPGTAEGVKRIQSVFERNNIPSVVYTQQQATEEKFKSLSGASPTFIHLATHGFFLPDPEIKKREGVSADNRNSFTLANDPLLRSGIILAGANRVWSGLAPIDGREDGVVTAYEISQLDLSSTNLVVLSACETALGDVRGNDGVFGLQRAFKLAGVKNMILSLWSVPDKETGELMSAFYDYYLQGRPVKTAFALAQHDMHVKYKPYFWAAFVLIE